MPMTSLAADEGHDAEIDAAAQLAGRWILSQKI